MPSGERVILFAPGAGAPSSSAWMRAYAERLAPLGHVECFDYPYQAEGRRSPDRLPTLIAAHERALERASAGRSGPIVLAGKSMGGRVGCHVAAAGRYEPAALVCFGYPLVGRDGSSRDAVLLELRTPVLFVQGTRDPLCPTEHLMTVRARMTAPNALHLVEGGDHSLGVRKRELAARGETQSAVNAGIIAAVRVFLDEHA